MRQLWLIILLLIGIVVSGIFAFITRPKPEVFPDIRNYQMGGTFDSTAYNRRIARVCELVVPANRRLAGYCPVYKGDSIHVVANGWVRWATPEFAAKYPQLDVVNADGARASNETFTGGYLKELAGIEPSELVMPSASPGTLLARIDAADGREGEWAYLGREYRGVVPRNGMMFFVVNDVNRQKYYLNNSGQYYVVVHLTRIVR